MTIAPPILVTGAHRTGTTWVGKMLAAHPQVGYISEPLNVWHRPGVLGIPVSKWYMYISKENEGEFLPAFQDTLAFRYGLIRELKALRSWNDLLRLGRDAGRFSRGQILHQRPLLKDPFAVFSSLWFEERLNCQVIITVRHPAGFASSLQRLNWSFDFCNLLDQPVLMQKYLEEDREAMETISTGDVVGQAALLWRMIYRFVYQAVSLHPSLVVVRHEDLSRDPITGFKNLYTTLGLSFTPREEHKILQTTSSRNPAELADNKVHSIKLDSCANIFSWKKRLSKDNIDRVRQLTGDVAQIFYSEAEW